jgi:hypothetical protein
MIVSVSLIKGGHETHYTRYTEWWQAVASSGSSGSSGSIELHRRDSGPYRTLVHRALVHITASLPVLQLYKEGAV